MSGGIRIAVDPHLWAEVDLVGPGGVALGRARFKCRAMRRSEYLEALEGESAALVRSVVVGWEGFEQSYSAGALEELLDVLPSAAAQIQRAYQRELYAVDRKN